MTADSVPDEEPREIVDGDDEPTTEWPPPVAFAGDGASPVEREAGSVSGGGETWAEWSLAEAFAQEAESPGEEGDEPTVEWAAALASAGNAADEPTGEWPVFAAEETDPVGFAPIEAGEYPPASDPFHDENDDEDTPLPEWDVAPEKVPSRRQLFVVSGIFALLALIVGAILVIPRGDGGGGGRNDAVAAADGLSVATFELVDGAGSVRVRAGDIGGALYQVNASDGVKPRVERDGGDVRAFLPPGASGSATSVDVVLNAAVRWTLRLHGGTKSSQVDLAGAKIDAVELAGGASRIDLTLPAPRGLMPVRMTGGVDQFLVRLAGATPVRVRVQSGAGRVTLAGATYQGIAPGRSFTAYGWGTGGAGVDLLAVAGMSALTVEP